MAEFVDQTGRSGPSTWSAGDYAAGQDDYPVSGVSWYEAAAYAEYAGKSLPTGYHWSLALNGNRRGQTAASPAMGWLVSLSNFKGNGPVAVGSSRSMTAYGAYDMGGNVREWCWNQTRAGRSVRGGAWNDQGYMANSWSQADPFDRSPKNGFRCARYIEPEIIPPGALAVYEPPPRPDYYKEKPAPDAVYQVYKAQFDYDKTPLGAQTERRDSAQYWIQEKVTFDATYGGEKMAAYLFLPKNSSPPYQTVVYFPGTGAAQYESSEDLGESNQFSGLSFIVKTGRASRLPHI